ncbi:hypothetical protein ACOSP7_030686 [Xanthoceras sorbifolium]
MGIWDYISSKIDSINRNARHLASPVKDLCQSSYGHSRVAVHKIHDTVKVNAVEKLLPYMPEEETRSKIAANLAKNSARLAFREGLKFLPGGSIVYDIVSQSLSVSGNKISKEYSKELKDLKDKVRRLEKEGPIEMGIWDHISSKTDSIKRNAPHLTSSVKDLCQNSYDHSRVAVNKIHDTVKVNAVEKLLPHLPDEETRSKIAADLAKNSARFAFREGLKFLPGGSMVYNIVSQSHSISGNKISKEHSEELKDLKDKVRRLEEEVSDCKKSVEQTELPKPTTKLQSKI